MHERAGRSDRCSDPRTTIQPRGEDSRTAPAADSEIGAVGHPRVGSIRPVFATIPMTRPRRLGARRSGKTPSAAVGVGPPEQSARASKPMGAVNVLIGT